VETVGQLLRLLAAATALSIASVHVAILNQHLEEKTYVGALFLAAILALQLVALELAQSRRDPLLDAASSSAGLPGCPATTRSGTRSESPRSFSKACS
jgi:hypothetical protein